MDYARVVLGLGMSVLLAACNNGGADAEQASREAALEEVPAARGVGMVSATVGPLRYQFDATELIMTEVLIAVPPALKDEFWAAKLIPIQRAERLGQDVCRYDKPGRATTCEAEYEPGLTLVVLERPPADYQQEFIRRGMGEALSPAPLGDRQGFTFTAQAEGSKTEYRFLPMQDRTVLLARKFINGQHVGDEAIDDVIRRVTRSLETAAG